MTDVIITGLEEIHAAMGNLTGKPVERVMTAALRAGLNVVNKQMKADLSPTVKDARKAVKTKVKGGRKPVAKVGFGVGRKKKKTQTLKVQKKRSGGVGIGPQNVHWWVAGTKERRTGFTKSGKLSVAARRGHVLHSTGRMPAMQPGLARMAYAKTAGKIRKAMIERGALQMVKEVNKLKQ